MKQTKILIVDDEAAVRNILKRTVQKVGVECTLTGSVAEARQALSSHSFDLVLCDLYLPGESGMDLVKSVHSEHPDTGVIMISGEDDPDVARQALEMGAYGYIIKPFKINEIIINISSALRRQHLEAEHRAKFENLEHLIDQRTRELQNALTGVVQAIANTLEFRDPYTAGHQRQVGGLALALAQVLECPVEESKGIHLAGMIHDLGKISVPAEILSKPSKLSDIEFTLIKAHPRVGYDILRDINFPWPIADLVHQHHERLDGSGYPQGLKNGEILFGAKVLAVADVVEAMSSHRPYRPGLGLDAALQEIERAKGTLFDPLVVDSCLWLFREKKFSLREASG